MKNKNLKSILLFSNATIIEQSGRIAGDPIIEGMTFKVKLNIEQKEEETEEETTE